MGNFKFLIIGSNGLLGSNIVKILKKKKISYYTSARNHSDYNLDLKNFKNLKKLFLKNNYEIVVNCAAKVNINYCENNYSEAKKINSTFVNFLSILSKKFHFKLVHISTDHVYKGKKFRLNNEEGKIYAINKYAKTKILAEKYVKKYRQNLIIRTNFTGKKKDSFIDWLIKNIKKNKKIKLFDDMYTSTIDVKNCAGLIIKLAMTNSNGIYNLGTSDMISKKQFAIKVSKILNKKIFYTTASIDILKVPRGKNLGLNVKKIEKKLNLKMISSNKSIKNNLKEYL
tara:strand:+ start:240 stop:1091 length:852 start_codon:yes stop_codon:yes gene_type:complete